MPTLQLHTLTFAYPEQTPVFENHSLTLAASTGLCGIIGPSGTGKTTLVSILGGQLKPQQGEVLVAGTNIYEVNDRARQSLIGVQMQASTSLRGKLRENLEFGLPPAHCQNAHTEEALISLLIDVGLWDLFKDKKGLQTLIGEGGLNLSGGQRQRLNFASLFLRTSYYKPRLLLIDEPTSSLDEISEQAITRMIATLAESALTLVVAHRLKTLDKANAILDISLASTSRELKFLKRSELLKESSYYQALRNGKAELDS